MDDSGTPPETTNDQEIGTQPIPAREAAPPPRWPRGYVWRDPATGEEHVLVSEDVSLIVDPDPEVELESTPALSAFRRLDIGPGDVLVYETPHKLTQANAGQIRDHLAKYFPGVEVLIVGDGARLYVASAPPAREQIDASTLGQAPGSVTVEGRRIGTCPVCGSTVPLDEAGRVGPHITLMGAGPCRGTGRFTSDVAFP